MAMQKITEDWLEDRVSQMITIIRELCKLDHEQLKRYCLGNNDGFGLKHLIDDLDRDETLEYALRIALRKTFVR